jgi:hypothetical protein
MFQEPPDGQGVYEECRLSDSACVDRLKQIADLRAYQKGPLH